MALGFCIINGIHLMKNIFFLMINRKSHFKIKLIYWTEFQISAGYLIYFMGFLLTLLKIISYKFLPLFACPYLMITTMLFFSNIENNLFLAQKKFAIFEGVQLALIATKFSMPQLVNWNYALIFFMAGSIYLTVLGLLLTIILSCSLFGFLYRGLERWKIKSLIWMTFFYLFTGLTFIYVIKGVIEYYDDENIITRVKTNDYVWFKSENTEILQTSAWMMVVLNTICLFMHVLWSEDIKKYLSRVIYKNDLRREISLRTLSKNFSFKVIQYSAVFFKTEDKCNEIEEKGKAEEKENSVETKNEINENKEGKVHEDSECVICFDAKPNIIYDPCGHGAVCKECSLEYIKNEETCMFCRKRIEKLYIIEYDQNNHCHFAKGEINLKI